MKPNGGFCFTMLTMIARSIRPLRAVSSAAVLLVLTGCVGFGVLHEKTHRYEACSIRSRVGSVSNADEGEITHKTEPARRWGRPEDIERNRYGQQIWVYPNGSAWYGIMPMFIIPIPLVFPVGDNYTYITIANNRVQSCRQEYTSWSGFMCSLYTTPDRQYCGFLKD